MERWLICVNKFFRFALKRYFISKNVRCFWRTLYIQRKEPLVPIAQHIWVDPTAGNNNENKSKHVTVADHFTDMLRILHMAMSA
jgi:hypothetical protein